MKNKERSNWLIILIIFSIVSWQHNKYFWGLFILVFATISVFLSEEFNVFVELSKSDITKDECIDPKTLNAFKARKASIFTYLLNFSAVTAFIHIFYPKQIQKLVNIIELPIPKHMGAIDKLANLFLLNTTTTLLLIIMYFILIGLEMGIYISWKNNFVSRY